MLSERRIEIIKNWDDKHKGERDEVREVLAESLLSLLYIRELPPKEARDIFQSTVSEYMDYSGSRTMRDGIDPAFIDEWIHQQKSERLIRKSISVLFNAVDESTFETGFNEGIEETVEWWKGSTDYTAEIIDENIECNRTQETKMDIPPRKFRYRKLPSQPPQSEKERYARIFRLSGDYEPPLDEGFLENIDSINIGNIDIEQLSREESVGTDIDWSEVEDYDAVWEDLLPGDFAINEDLKKAIESILKQRRIAKKLALALNNKQNPSGVFFGSKNKYILELLPDWYVREYMKLHEEYLKDKGIFPDEKKIPEYTDHRPRVPYPPNLNLCEWEDTNTEGYSVTEIDSG